jgi:hypothetical protein
VTLEQTKLFAEALARGEEHRRQIALTIGRDMLDEKGFSASPSGIPERLKERVTGLVGRGDSGDED